MRRLAGITLGVACALASTGADARAGTYEVFACALPDLTAVGADGWRTFGEKHVSLNNSCARATGRSPGVMQGVQAAAANREAGGFVFTAPTGTTVTRLALTRAAFGTYFWGEPHLPLSFWAVTQGRAEEGPGQTLETCGPGSGMCEVGLGSFSDRGASSNVVVFRNLRAEQVFAYLRCIAGCPSGHAQPARFNIYSAAVELTDYSPPDVEPSQDDLTRATSPVSGERTFELTARDIGGGIASVGLLANGLEVFQRPVNAADTACREPYVRVVPCPLNARVNLALDTARLTNGKHVLQFFAIDVAGNRRLSVPFEIVTKNGAAPNGEGATPFAKLRAWFSARRGRQTSRTVAYGRTAVMYGELTGPSGTPIVGAELDVLAQDRRVGAPQQVIGRARTDARGRISYRVPAGPARELTLGYRANILDDWHSATAVARLNVRAGVLLTVTPRRVRNGRRITFAGRLLGGPDRSDVTVVLYALDSGTRSRIPVESLRTDQAGRFRFRYRFRTVARPTRFRFLARVQRQSGYPYVGGTSRAAAVKVIP
jgi:hypothetical protein